MIWLLPLFALTALIYASVGFAGGSTYTALLVLAEVDHRLVPLVSLACNIVVATGGVVQFARARAIAWRKVAPLLLVSIPLAWIGGRLLIDKALFVQLLGWSLLVAGVLLLSDHTQSHRRGHASSTRTHWLAIALAAPIGLLSGIVGIGGGIFLAPCLHLMQWDQSKRIAGAAALFILVNSIAGLAGQVSKLSPDVMMTVGQSWWPHVLAVLIAGQAGSLIGVRLLSPILIRRITGVVILVAAARLLSIA